MKKQGRTKTKSHTPELMNQFCGGTALRETQSCIRDTPEHETSDKREKKTMRLASGVFEPDLNAQKELSKSYEERKECFGVHVISPGDVSILFLQPRIGQPCTSMVPNGRKNSKSLREN